MVGRGGVDVDGVVRYGTPVRKRLMEEIAWLQITLDAPFHLSTPVRSPLSSIASLLPMENLSLNESYYTVHYSKYLKMLLYSELNISNDVYGFFH